jgi:hypothetical protein
MLAQLVKVANRLDSLGLTKEADILDLEIIRLASEPPKLSLLHKATLNHVANSLREKKYDDAQIEKAIEYIKENRYFTKDVKVVLTLALDFLKSKAEESSPESPSLTDEESSSGNPSSERTPPTQIVTLRRRRTEDPSRDSSAPEYSASPKPTMNYNLDLELPKTIREVGPNLFYSFKYETPDGERPYWLVDGVSDEEGSLRDTLMEGFSYLLLPGKKVLEYLEKGRFVSNDEVPPKIGRLRLVTRDPEGLRPGRERVIKYTSPGEPGAE